VDVGDSEGGHSVADELSQRSKICPSIVGMMDDGSSSYRGIVMERGICGMVGGMTWRGWKSPDDAMLA
jgi:hypothetical protein